MKKFVFCSKVALLLVVIGFFQPIACNQNGVNLANACWEFGNYTKALLIWAIFLAAFISVCITAYNIYWAYKEKKEVEDSLALNWFLVGGGIISIFIAQSGSSNEYGSIRWESGAYFILIGYVLSVVLLIADRLKNEDSSDLIFNFDEQRKKIESSSMTQQEKENSNQREKWISKRLLELLKEGKTATDARIQAEAEYEVKKDSEIMGQKKQIDSFSVKQQENMKKEWISNRLLELTKEGKTEIDARIQAEAEYSSVAPFEGEEV